MLQIESLRECSIYPTDAGSCALEPINLLTDHSSPESVPTEIFWYQNQFD